LIAESTNLARARKLDAGRFELYDGARGLVEALKLRGIKLGVVSNAPEDAVKTTLRLLSVEEKFDYFRGIESFTDLKARKPHPDHIRVAKAELKDKPFLYIGDQESDVNAAIDAGIDSVWVNRDGGSISPDPTYEVCDLFELGERLEVF